MASEVNEQECQQMHECPHCQQPEKTSDYYTTSPDLPERFENPSLMKAYGCYQPKNRDPHFRTTYSDIGFFPPSVHTVSARYFPKKTAFAAGGSGKKRSYALNM